MGEYITNPVISRYFKTQVEGKYRFIEYDQYSEEDLNVTASIGVINKRGGLGHLSFLYFYRKG
jgi:hypothetical protein